MEIYFTFIPVSCSGGAGFKTQYRD